MAIDANELLTGTLPAQEWDFVLRLIQAADAPHQPRAKILASLDGQMRQQTKRIEERAAVAAKASEMPPDHHPV